MLTVLIIDDSAEKIKRLKGLVRSYAAIKKTDVDIVDSKLSAIDKLEDKQYDLVLLDIVLPEEIGDDPNPENGIELLDLIKNDDSIIKPGQVVGITEKELDKCYIDSFTDSMFFLLKFDAISDVWEKQLRNLIDYRIKYKMMTEEVNDYIYDVAIINALRTPENEKLRKALGNEWKVVNYPKDSCTTYYETEIQIANCSKIRVITCFANQMASTASAMLTTKVLFNFRPKYLFMTGIAAAIDSSEVSLGDVLVASEVWDGASGKIKETEEEGKLFQPDYRQLSLDKAFLNIVDQLKDNKQLLQDIYDKFEFSSGKPNEHLRIHTGPMASVPAVLASQDEIEKIKVHSRKLLGIEMETYGMFYAAANAIEPRPKYVASLKSCSDYANEHKGNKYQEYAAYTSAEVLKYLIVNKLLY